MKGLCPQQFYQLANIHQYPTRHNNELDIPKFQTTTGQKIFHFRAFKLWNSLDDDIKSIGNFKTFSQNFLEGTY